MNEEQELEDFKYNIALTNVCYNIKNKLNLNETSKTYIDWTKELFQNVTKSLDSIVSLKEGEGYFITPHLREIIECNAGEKSSVLVEDVEKLKGKFYLMLGKLDNLKKNPQEFYKTRDSEEIFNFLDKLSSCFVQFQCN